MQGSKKRDEIILIGPPFAGKSTVGKLLAEKLALPQASLDDLRWAYFREIGYDEALAQELQEKGGFLSLVTYWCLFNTYAIERAITEHTNCVIDCGGGPIVFESSPQRDKIRTLFARYQNVVRLLPSPDVERSVKVLRERGSHLVGTNAQGFDWARFFVDHDDNYRLAKFHIYTDGKTPKQTRDEILKLIGLNR